jgi:hypothetical protein
LTRRLAIAALTAAAIGPAKKSSAFARCRYDADYRLPRSGMVIQFTDDPEGKLWLVLTVDDDPEGFVTLRNLDDFVADCRANGVPV